MFLWILVVSVIVVMVILFISFLLSFNNDKSNSEMSVYECGFEMMVESRVSFSYRFFLISILFLLFDVEVCLILPLPYLVGGGVEIVVLMFMMVLIIGLMYEYYNGAINWV